MILVVGGAGFIGSHMVKRLAQAGEPFLVFDNLERGHRAARRGAPLVEGDLRSKSDLDAVLASNEIDLVMHFAAYIEVGESVTVPAAFWENNVVGVHNLLEAMRRHRVGRFIFSSTAAVYGEPVRVPIDEGHPTAPTSPYGDTKLAVERMLAAYDRAYGLRSVCLRYFNAAGADPDGEIGEDHRPETHLLPRLLLAALGRGQFSVFGDDYPTDDGTCVRDYVHVCDLVEAHLLAAHWLREGGASEVFNLGNGQGHSVREVVRAAERMIGREIQVGQGPRREGDPARLVASSEKARRVLGWEPKYGEIDRIVADAWRWFSTRPGGYQD
jgi:UDP-glucose 4-epimerase